MEEWVCFQACNPGLEIRKCIGKLVKDGKYFVPRMRSWTIFMSSSISEHKALARC